MLSEPQRRILARAIEEQEWMGLRKHLPALDRICQEGPERSDLPLVRRIIRLATAKIHLDIIERIDLDKEKT